MVLTVRTTSNDICTAAYGPTRITDNHICTFGLTPNTGFCTTDVGSPLIHNANLIGIASWHPLPCGSAVNPVSRLLMVFFLWEIYLAYAKYGNMRQWRIFSVSLTHVDICAAYVYAIHVPSKFPPVFFVILNFLKF